MSYMRIDDGNADGQNFFFVGMVDIKIREAMHFCWMMLPDESRTTSRVADELRRILERAIKDNQDDERAFSGESGK